MKSAVTRNSVVEDGQSVKAEIRLSFIGMMSQTYSLSRQLVIRYILTEDQVIPTDIRDI